MTPNFTRAWAMPSAETFSIPPIHSLVMRYLEQSKFSIDPFARNTSLATVRNDLCPETSANYHLTCEDFAQMLAQANKKPDLVLWDPPYSYRQAVEVYKGVGREWTKRDQQQVGRWSKTKDILARLVTCGGFVVSCGWSTTGFGKQRGFEPIEWLCVNHGSAHNDTLVTVEHKL